ncbi:MAG: hypothetical protein JWN14_22 [Chthonomonadales bacterium]|nr:hypothetical protein [Chthonomonadales bacterium]
MEESEKEEILRQARSILGSIKTEKKTASSRANIVHATEARTGATLSEEHKQKLREAQAARRQREKAQRDAAAPPAPKRPRGRPRKQEGQEANG